MRTSNRCALYATCVWCACIENNANGLSSKATASRCKPKPKTMNTKSNRMLYMKRIENVQKWEKCFQWHLRQNTIRMRCFFFVWLVDSIWMWFIYFDFPFILSLIGRCLEPMGSFSSIWRLYCVCVLGEAIKWNMWRWSRKREIERELHRPWWVQLHVQCTRRTNII